MGITAYIQIAIYCCKHQIIRRIMTVMKLINPKLLGVIIFSLALLLNSCSKKSIDEPKEVILTKIGDKTISLNEFIRRAEYTIRPPYCRENNNIHKKIILNSLIAEKMLALEAGEENELAQNERFQRYIQGRKEQAMRQWLYHKEIYGKVKLDPKEITKIYRVEAEGIKFNILVLKIPQLLKRLKEN